MSKNYKLLTALFSFILLAAFLISGCVNYDQKTTLNDGSDHENSLLVKDEQFQWDKSNLILTKTKKTIQAAIRCEKRKMEDKLMTVPRYVELSFKDINNCRMLVSGVQPSWKERRHGA
jgi:hypothetical protein